MSRINVNDIVGKKFNKLTVLEFHHKKSNPDPKRGYFYYYKCQCDCGNINHLITFRKETHTLTQWAKMLGLNRSTLWYRLKRGWTIKRALTTPTN